MEEQQINKKNFAPMPIAGLLDGEHHFVIPSFQRGYRWEKKQVIDLLEDIKQFSDGYNSKSDSYFLQPIVVKAVQYNGQNAFEVLDGQQRLTTMLLILKEMLRGYMAPKDTSKYAPLLYDINYKNRPQLNFDKPDAAANIDSYYLNEARLVIEQWCEKNEDFTEIIRCLFYSTVQRQVKIIWYAIDTGNGDLLSINIFNRLNKGKISLTSSELIKALFIMDYELCSKDGLLSPDQLSMEWNEMERQFQNDNFWYFISDDTKGIQTRMDVLFDFVTCRDKNKDSDYSYREFQRLFDFCRDPERKKSNDNFVCEWSSDLHNMQDAWKLIRKTFDRLVAWHEDNLYYHYIGYLVAIGFTPMEIYNYLENEKRSGRKEEQEWTIDATKIVLQRKMMDKFKKNNKYIEKESIDEFEYKSDYLNIRRILLLFNIESCRISKNVRFAFDSYKKGHWDVEHIEAQNDATLQEYDDRMRWLKNVKFIFSKYSREIPKELVEECQKLICDFTDKKEVAVEKYRDFYLKVNKFNAAKPEDNYLNVDLTTMKKDYLSNLTLLDSATNREYKDAPFAYKRYCIVKYDKQGDRFIPLCTRNLFLKYYTNSDKESTYLDTMRWNDADREGYIEAIHAAVDPIFDSVIK